MSPMGGGSRHHSSWRPTSRGGGASMRRRAGARGGRSGGPEGMLAGSGWTPQKLEKALAHATARALCKLGS